MLKRGQVGIFAVIGIIVIVLVILFLFIRTRVYIGPATQQDLEAELIPIKEHIENCLLEKAEPRLRQIGLQGGYIATPENTYRLYNGNRVSFLCYNIDDKPYCRQRVLKLGDMEQQLEQVLKEELLRQCINVQSFRKLGTALRQGELRLDIIIGEDSTTINADFPISLAKGDAKAELKAFSTIINYPLGRLYNAVRDILNVEAETGSFDTTFYSYQKTQLTNKLYIAQINPIYPDELYILKIKDAPSEEDPYIFQFFVEGEPQ